MDFNLPSLFGTHIWMIPSEVKSCQLLHTCIAPLYFQRFCIFGLYGTIQILFYYYYYYLAVLVQYRHVTDGWTTDGQRLTHDDSIYHASIASCGKIIFEKASIIFSPMLGDYKSRIPKVKLIITASIGECPF